MISSAWKNGGIRPGNRAPGICPVFAVPYPPPWPAGGCPPRGGCVRVLPAGFEGGLSCRCVFPASCALPPLRCGGQADTLCPTLSCCARCPLEGSSWVTGAGAEGHSGGRARSGGCPGTGAAGWCGFGSGCAVRQGPAQEAPFQGQGRRPEANRERASCARTAGGNVFGAASGKEEAQAPSARRSAA